MLKGAMCIVVDISSRDAANEGMIAMDNEYGFAYHCCSILFPIQQNTNTIVNLCNWIQSSP